MTRRGREELKISKQMGGIILGWPLASKLKEREFQKNILFLQDPDDD